MGIKSLTQKAEAATQAVADAELGLEKVVGEIALAPRSEKTEATVAVRNAFSRLKATREKLDAVKKLVAFAKLTAAQGAVDEAENHLDRVIDQIAVATRAEKTVVNDVVVDAFSKLKAARRELADLAEFLAARGE